MNDLARTFSALADETRLSLVDRLLSDGELPAGDLAQGLDITAPAVSRHLKVLRQAGVIAQRAEGTRRLYSIRPEALKRINGWTMDHRAVWADSLDRLDGLLALDPEGDT
ncbi:ArsR/SmtB family transcription factor [Pseudooceanicola aestuarii]|uniref:ArsR/SmtB family transcription factor n=1 Tax=Pseudooceanicola aestuarii TaxID=2697319 RepID=UPI0013D204E0|nr:metalloregulator ArsR/SmtB family transcription factor [Pseudooceanicola aestuarii]